MVQSDKPITGLKPEDKPTLEQILAIEPSQEQVDRLKQLFPIDEKFLTPEVNDWLVRKESRTLAVVYNQLIAGMKVKESDVDELLKNSIDVHCHGGSDPIERLLPETEIGYDFTQAGMRAMNIKTWYTPSASRNQIVQAAVDQYAEKYGLRPTLCLGGITLNYSVGGFNVDAVKKCLGFPGMRYVWMPMVDSYHHRRVVYDDWSGYGLKFTDDNYRIIPEVQDILRVIADNDLVLASGHYPYEDTAALIEEARRLGVNRIEVIHPNLVHSKHTIEQLKKQAERGAKLMFRSKGLVTFPMDLEPPYAARMIKEVGAQHFVHGSDFGQPHHLPHVVGIRLSIKTLLSFGISAEEVRMIYQDNPAELLGLPLMTPEEKAAVPAIPMAGSGRYTDIPLPRTAGAVARESGPAANTKDIPRCC